MIEGTFNESGGLATLKADSPEEFAAALNGNLGGDSKASKKPPKKRGRKNSRPAQAAIRTATSKSWKEARALSKKNGKSVSECRSIIAAKKQAADASPAKSRKPR